MVYDSNDVYTMSTDTLSALTDKSEEDFWDLTVSYVSLNSLGSLKVNYQGSEYKVNVSRETSTDDDGNDTETVTYKLNGSDLDETTFTTFYNKLINMAAQKRLTEKNDPDGDAELTVTFTEEDGDTLEVSYYSYDTNYYAAVVDNKVYLVNKMNVKELFTAFESVAGVEKDDTKRDSDDVESDEKASADVETDSETETSDNSDAVTDDDSKSASASDTTDTSESDTEELENVNKDHSNSIIFWNCYKKASIHRNKSACRSFLCLRTTFLGYFIAERLFQICSSLPLKEDFNLLEKVFWVFNMRKMLSTSQCRNFYSRVTRTIFICDGLCIWFCFSLNDINTVI